MTLDVDTRESLLLSRPLLFFGGKGGVGKTTVAAAAAVRSAEIGCSTLLVSTDPAHSAGDALGVQLGPQPQPVLPLLSALEIDPDAEAERYIRSVKERVREVTSPRLLAEVEREIDAARVSPGATEAALFERLAELALLAGDHFDRVIFDTAPTGHTLRLLSLPELMTVWIDGLVRRRRKANVLSRMWRNVAGAAASNQSPPADPVLQALELRRDRFRVARTRLTDPRLTAFHFVVTPARLPILETRRAVEALDRYGIPIGSILVNRVLLPDETDDTKRRRFRQAEYLAEIRSVFAGRLIALVPELDIELCGADALRVLHSTLTIELDAPGA